MPEAKRSPDEAATARDAMLDRLKAEQARGWPRSRAGVWLDDTQGYAPLDGIPLSDAVEFEMDRFEPIPPDQQQLPDQFIRPPSLFDDDDGDKASRRQARRDVYNRTGAVD